MSQKRLHVSVLVTLGLLASSGYAQDNAEVPPPNIAPEAAAAAVPAVTPVKAKKKRKGGGNRLGPAPVRDTSVEAQFHQTYLKYNSQPTSEEVWTGVVTEKNANTYLTQSGDTLWDISTTLFADPYFWPKIWSLNTQKIGNPHEISPNTTLVFIPGTVSEPPSVVAEEAPVKEEAPADSGVEGAKPAKKDSSERKTLAELPDSLPRLRFFKKPAPPSEVQLDLKPVMIPNRQEKISYVLNEQEVKEDGRIVEAEAGLKSAGTFQHVYVRFEGKPAKKYYVYKELSSLKSPYKFFYSGDIIELQGEIEVLEQVNASKNIYRAIVTYTETSLEVGSYVKAGPIPTFTVEGGENNAQSFARVIGAQYSKDRHVIGNANLIFLDAGTSDGFKVGQTFNIFEDNEIRLPGTDVEDADHKIATAKVVDANSKFITAYVLKSSKEIEVGDYAGPKKDHQASQADAGAKTGAIDDVERSDKNSGIVNKKDDDLDLDTDSSAQEPTPATKKSDEGLDEGSLDPSDSGGGDSSETAPPATESAPSSDSSDGDLEL